jgi:tetratricopeptide (TPR) repeat protein
MDVNFRLEEMLDNADHLIREGRIDDAVNLLNEIIMEDPLYGKAHNHLGYVYETKVKDYLKAAEHYKICLQSAPDYTPVYYNYSILLSMLKRFDEQKLLLEKALLVPGINKATIMNEFAILYEGLEQWEKAIEAYREVVRSTFDNKVIDAAIESVVRCEKKKRFLTGEDNIDSYQSH